MASDNMAQNAPDGKESKKTKQTPAAQAGSGISVGDEVKQTRSKPEANLPPEVLALPPLPRAPSASPPLPAGTVPILPTPCAVCGAAARFATKPGTPVCPACWAKAHPENAEDKPAEPAAPSAAGACGNPVSAFSLASLSRAPAPEDNRPWWERGAEPPCHLCGRPAGNGRDQWARPLCVDCWFDLPQAQQMRASMPDDEPGHAPAPAAWKEVMTVPPAPPPDALAEACWLCGDVVECFDPAGQGWCEGCLRAGPERGWQDVLEALPEGLRDDRLAIFAASAYHGADRPALWLDSGRIGSGEQLRGAEVFARLGAALAADDEPTRCEARDRLTALVISSGLSLRPF